MSVFHRQRPGWRFPRAVRAEGIHVWDDQGRRLIDAAGGALVVGVGHGVAEIADAIGEQARRLAYVHGSELTSEPVEALARELARRTPVDDARLYLVAGGSEANETAIKLARQYHVARGDVSRRPSYRGCTIGALAVSGRPALRHDFEPLLPAMPHVPAPYPYRCTLAGCGRVCSLECARAIASTIEAEGSQTVAACGLGLMAAVEIVADRGSRAPYPRGERMAQRIQAEAIERGAIAGVTRA